MKWQIDLAPFILPNGVPFVPPIQTEIHSNAPGDRPVIPVGNLSDDQAKEYWAWMEGKWLAHVTQARKRKEQKEDEAATAAMRGGGSRR